MNNKRLRRSKDSKIAGIAGGIAEFLEIDPVIIRAMFLFLIFFGGVGVILYFTLLFVMPSDPSQAQQAKTVDYSTVNEKEEEKEETKKVNNDTKIASAIAGICLIFIGLLFLMKHIIPVFWCKLYLPFLLIFAGILFLIIPLITKKK